MKVLLILLLLLPQARVRPPATLACDRSSLTSFSGTVTSWSRTDETATLSMDTDFDTKERFLIRFERSSPLEKWFLLEGEPFRAADWNKVEATKTRLRPGVKATVWVCEGSSANPVIDWRLPPR